jgi:competence protein ComEC
MVTFAVFFAFGAWLLQQQPALPGLAWACLALIPLALLVMFRAAPRRAVRPALIALLACLLGFFHAAFLAQQRLADALPEEWQGKDIALAGVVAELPRQREGGLSFAFDVEQTLTPGARVPRHILLSTYDGERGEALPLHAGERWQLTVRLKRPHGVSNPYGFDFEEWMLEQDLRATGYVRSNGTNTQLDARVPAPGYVIERLRETVRSRFQAELGNAPYTGVLTALAIGDQGSIPQAQWQVFTRTGVNHLMSISGLHITMLAALAFALTRALWRRSASLTLRFPARKAAALAGLLAALAYALLSGYSVPAQRTVYMLSTVAAALLMSRNIAASQLLAAALTVVVAADPWAVLSPGFWLSFGAVALILYVTAHRLWHARGLDQDVGEAMGHSWYSWTSSLRQNLLEYGRVQWAMMIGMIPPLLALFQQISLASPLANAFAIPLVSFVVVPFALLGALLPLHWPLWLAHEAMALCMAGLEWLNHAPEAVWTQHAPPAWSIALGMGGAVWALLPRGFPARWLGLLLMLPMFLALPAVPPEGALRLVVFDVGQGLSVMAQTHNHALLYDAGPDFPGETDSGNRILLPSLRAQGVAELSELILTHDDTDHTGGALSVLHGMPVGLLSSSLPGDSPIVRQAPNPVRCQDGQRWEWDGVQFEVLHPARASYADENISKNNRGCTLRISAGKHAVLLAADIEKDSERRLLQLHPDKLPATLLVVPHHGSKTSSTPEFVEAVRPGYAVFTAGYRNRFGHPKPEVLERYRAAGSELLRSDEDGAVLVDMDAESFSVERYRKTHVRYWFQ